MQEAWQEARTRAKQTVRQERAEKKKKQQLKLDGLAAAGSGLGGAEASSAPAPDFFGLFRPADGAPSGVGASEAAIAEHAAPDAEMGFDRGAEGRSMSAMSTASATEATEELAKKLLWDFPAFDFVAAEVDASIE